MSRAAQKTRILDKTTILKPKVAEILEISDNQQVSRTSTYFHYY